MTPPIYIPRVQSVVFHRQALSSGSLSGRWYAAGVHGWQPSSSLLWSYSATATTDARSNATAFRAYPASHRTSQAPRPCPARCEGASRTFQTAGPGARLVVPSQAFGEAVGRGPDFVIGQPGGGRPPRLLLLVRVPPRLRRPTPPPPAQPPAQPSASSATLTTNISTTTNTKSQTTAPGWRLHVTNTGTAPTLIAT